MECSVGATVQAPSTYSSLLSPQCRLHQHAHRYCHHSAGYINILIIIVTTVYSSVTVVITVCQQAILIMTLSGYCCNPSLFAYSLRHQCMSASYFHHSACYMSSSSSSHCVTTCYCHDSFVLGKRSVRISSPSISLFVSAWCNKQLVLAE